MTKTRIKPITVRHYRALRKAGMPAAYAAHIALTAQRFRAWTLAHHDRDDIGSDSVLYRVGGRLWRVAIRRDLMSTPHEYDCYSEDDKDAWSRDLWWYASVTVTCAETGAEDDISSVEIWDGYLSEINYGADPLDQASLWVWENGLLPNE